MNWKTNSDKTQHWAIHENGNYAYVMQDDDGFYYTAWIINSGHDDVMIQNNEHINNLAEAQAKAEEVIDEVNV